MLNAFRHQRINHTERRSFLIASKCAQRLSASTDKSPLINLDSLGRLNCAQRLSASTDKSLNRIAVESRGTESAQRLSASTDKSLWRWTPNSGDLHTVLNAFRHQRINHSVGRTCEDCQRLVLNAFRHQRINHVTCGVQRYRR